MTGPFNELHTRRVDAVRAWTTFIEHGDGAGGLVRPEILRSWERSAPAVGIDVAEATLPDLVILDLYMPRRDGMAALPLLRSACPDARVLVVSAHAAVEVFEQSRSRGATACFDKLSFLPRIPALLERYGAVA